MGTGSVRWERFRAVLTFEVRAQAREPLTTLYALVFFFLSVGYAASDAVELVSDRGGCLARHRGRSRSPSAGSPPVVR
jgi:hypothetical protein